MTNLKDKIFDKIEKQKIEPTPKSHFEWTERIKWMLIWIFTTFWIMFILFLIDDLVEFISIWPWVLKWPWLLFFLPPLIWTLIIVVALFFVIREFRKTNSGYKYSIKFIIWIWIVVFLIGPLVFFRSWFGPSMHGEFVDRMPLVWKYIYNESTWNDPKNWKLWWEVISLTGETIELKSRDWSVWKIDINKVSDKKINFSRWDRIRVIWKFSWSWAFEAERIFPWFWRWWMHPWMMRLFDRWWMMNDFERSGSWRIERFKIEMNR
ncbi:MAG: hypothetical protein ACD_3C00025G0017 [uncultured bacterium (gcode 4)]|uniref:Uncharacterized protein n=1 Tax=uncultured bacterium (gcode 4) TaxID=1234023 RepID=K2G0H1_9BACT|nr:MAG: hypothetical protein ACD_3C00025G0017 [uncultured bacterium (gcode 4)]